MSDQIIKKAPYHKCAQEREVDYILVMTSSIVPKSKNVRISKIVYSLKIDAHNWTKKLYYTDNFQSFITKISLSKVFKNLESAFSFLQ
jgi:hypothetical protein